MAFNKNPEEEIKPTAADGSPLPMKALPIRKVDLESLAKITVPLKRRHLSAKGMFYGDSGTMKTTVAMRFAQAITPPDKRILYLDSAEGWSTLQNYEAEGLMDRVLHQPVESHEQLILMAQVLLMQKAPFDKVGCVLFDEYTQMVDSDLNWIVESRAEHVNSQEGSSYKDPFTPALPDYNATRIRSNKVLATFLRVPDVHLLFIGHEKKGDRAVTIPDMQDKAGKSLYQRLHFLYRTETVTPKEKGKSAYWRMQTVNGNRVQAKNRINGIPAYVTDIQQVIDAYKNWGVTDNNGKAQKPEPVVTEDDEATLEAILEGKGK